MKLTSLSEPIPLNNDEMFEAFLAEMRRTYRVSRDPEKSMADLDQSAKKFDYLAEQWLKYRRGHINN
jgi:hypothetical protein